MGIIEYLNAVTKFIYINPRPYWVHSEVNAKLCDLDFGMPSGKKILRLNFYVGHVMRSTLFYFLGIKAIKSDWFYFYTSPIG